MLCLIDTSGAYCGLGAEERGQGQAIAENLMEMMTLRTPVLALLIGEGGRRRLAFVLAVADQVWMMEKRGVFRDFSRGLRQYPMERFLKGGGRAECLKLTSHDLYKMNVIEKIIREPKNGG